MKKNIFKLVIILVLGYSCNPHEYYQENPNSPSNGTPALLLTKVITDVFRPDLSVSAFASRHITYYERPNEALNYGWNEAWYGSYGYDVYNILRNIKRMEELAKTTNSDVYLGLAKFFRAVCFSRVTDMVGDVPYSQALKLEEGIERPIYDKQEDIYDGILKELEEANTILSNAKSKLTGDVIYYGDSEKWRKAVNAYRLRLLIHLSKKEGNTKINVREQFNNIVSNPTKYPLMINNSDNCQIVFNETSLDNNYPLFNNLSFKSLVSLEKGFVSLLKERQDPRLFSFGEPIIGKAADKFENYEGVDAGLIISEQQNAAKKASILNKRFVEDRINEPWNLISYAEQEFLIAEGIARGWTQGNAASRYNNGIRASMGFYKIGGPQIDQYLNRPINKFDINKYQEQISIQKYIAMFLQCGWEPFFEQRRTGFPSFSIGPATLNDKQIPKRWRYPQSEYNNNLENLEKAIQAQYGGIDNVKGIMWLIK